VGSRRGEALHLPEANMTPCVPYFWCRSMSSGVTAGDNDITPLYTFSWSVCELKKGACAAECTLQVPVKSTAHGEVVDSKYEAPLHTGALLTCGSWSRRLVLLPPSNFCQQMLALHAHHVTACHAVCARQQHHSIPHLRGLVGAADHPVRLDIRPYLQNICQTRQGRVPRTPATPGLP
jgi:hypothetical protein